MLKLHPCKVTQFSTAKAGKHGTAKASIVGILLDNLGVDIFTGKKYEDYKPTKANICVPIIKKVDMPLLDLNEDLEVTLLLPSGGLKQ
jgi:translation initiation factor 5A